MADILKPDLCILGGGHAGLAVAMRAAQRGASVVIIETAPLGAAGRLADRLPAEILFAAGTRAQLLRDAGTYGLSSGEPKISFRALHDHMEAIVSDLARNDSMERCAALGIGIVTETARFIDRKTVVAGETQFKAKAFVLAPASNPVIPAIPGLGDVPYFTTDTVAENTRKFSHLLVIGAGASGLSLAQAYRRLGSDVTVVDAGRALAGTDPELTGIALRKLREEGVDLREGTAVAAITARRQGIGIELAANGEMAQLDVSHVLVASGRSADLTGFDLAKAGLKLTAKGHVPVDSAFRTANKAIFALGAAAGPDYAHNIEVQADLLVEQVLGGHRGSFGPAVRASIVLIDPAIAEIGLTEPMARAQLKTGYRVVRSGFGEIDAARATSVAGTAKLILDKSDRIVGAGVVGSNVIELASLFSLAVGNGLSIRQLGAFAAPEGSLAEIARHLAAKAMENKGKTSRPAGIGRWLPLPGRTL